ncbi:MAG: hypothetical protein ILP10_06730, partial [Lachnospiraceae bacterium]|nr:hypothetical protein [Lachnospiraceae bacterium]
MMKKRYVRTGSAVFTAVAVLSALAVFFHSYSASAASDGSYVLDNEDFESWLNGERPPEKDGPDSEERNPNGHHVGGGYAATGQIEGAYFMPVLYDASSGLPTSEANCVLADSSGHIWIGGYSGIVRYDGVSFDRLPIGEGLTSGRGMFEDSVGRIWVATNDSGVVVIEDDERTYIKKADGLGSNSVRTFAEDNKGNVFIGSTAGVSYVDTSMTLHTIDDERINTERVLRLVPGDQGLVYGHTGSGKVFSL